MSTVASAADVARRDVIIAAVRPVVIIAVMLVLYWFVPLDGDGVIVTVVATACIGLVIFAGVFAHQVRRIRRSRTPTLTAVEALVLVYGTFLIQFSVLYVALSATDPAAFDEPLNRMGGLYLTITILSTVGFGDISANSDVARLLVSVQMIADLVLIATAVRVLTAPLRKASPQPS
jgi:voltage-gated potassium channel